MAGAKFTYDERGSTFYYFVAAFYIIILIPLTYYYRPRKTKSEYEDEEESNTSCGCDGCLEKRALYKKLHRKKEQSNRKVYIALAVAWIIAAVIFYKVMTMENETVAFDPYEILQIAEDATQAAVRQAYRRLSKIHHPDRGGDPKKFIMISRAYKALANEESRKTWEEFGDPDGPQEIKFGIALPSWIVDKENSWMIVAFYFTVFLALPPTAIYFWWRRAVKFGSDKVLSDTVRLFTYQMHKSQSLSINRALMILGSAFEFCSKINPEAKERESDNEHLSKLTHIIGTDVKIACKEPPLGAPYSVKTRVLLLAYLKGVELPSEELKADQEFTLKKCLLLLREMIKSCCLVHLLYLYEQGKIRNVFNSMDTIFKLSQSIIQRQWGMENHPLLQLPHIQRDMIRHFQTKKRNIRSIADFYKLPDNDRRSLIRNLNDEEYKNVINVCAKLPYLKIAVDVKVLGENFDATVITTNSVVTIKLTISRCSYGDEFLDEPNDRKDIKTEVENIGVEDETSKPEPASPVSSSVQNKKQNKHKKTPKSKKPVQKKTPKKPNNVVASKDDNKEEDSDDDKADDEADDKSQKDSAVEDDIDRDDKDEWEVKMEKQRKDYLFGDTINDSPLVHCPYFPGVKRESWFVYLADKKQVKFLSEKSFTFVDDLVDIKEITFQFPAPDFVGPFGFYIVVRSDCYFEVDKRMYYSINVEEPKESHKAEVSDLESETESESEDHGEEISDDDFSANDQEDEYDD